MIRESCMALLLGASLAAAASAQTAGELLDKHAQASGGGKYRSLKAVRLTGKLLVSKDEEEQVVMEHVPSGHKLRMEITQKGVTDVRAIDGSAAWAVLRSEGGTSPVRLTGDSFDEMKSLARFQGRLFDALSSGGEVEYLGKGDLDGTPVQELKLPDTDGEETTVYLDAKSFLELREERSWSGHGQTLQYVTTYSDFRPVEGLTLPYKIQTTRKETASFGMVRTEGSQILVIDKIEVNPDLPASRFARPKP